MDSYWSADNFDHERHCRVEGMPVEEGRKFWNNDLRVVQITRLAAIPARVYADTGETSTWHDTTGGMFDTLTGHMRQYGRLARWFNGLDAEQYQPGTSYATVKNERGK